MIYLTLQKNHYSIPTRWEEMDIRFADNFVSMCSYFERFETGRCSYDELKTGIAASLTGLSSGRVRKVTAAAAENLFRISERTSFPILLKETDGSRTALINITLTENLQPEIKVRRLFGHAVRKCLHNFSVNAGGVVKCDITASIYTDMLDLLEAYGSSRDEDSLDMIFSTFYGQDGARVPRERKVAFYYNLRGYLDWIRDLPDYDLIFHGPGRRQTAVPVPSPLGSSGSIYTLSKYGFGTLDEIKSLPLFEYLGAMVRIVTDNIRELSGLDLTPGKIAEKLDLTLEQVLPYITSKNE